MGLKVPDGQFTFLGLSYVLPLREQGFAAAVFKQVGTLGTAWGFSVPVFISDVPV